MCLARVEFDGNQEAGDAVVTDVARIERTEEGLVVTDLFGAITVLDAEIKSVDFVDSVVSITEGVAKPCRG
jgi:predicted RNA-binding protein